MATLNDLIAAAVSSTEEVEDSVSPEVEKVASEAPNPIDFSEVEKVASALEFLGRRGIENTVKVAMHSEASKGPSSDLNEHKGNHAQSQVKSSPGVTQAPTDSSGSPDTNEKDRPGDGSAPDTSKKNTTHSSALSSSASAIDFTKKEKARAVAPDLAGLLDAKAFADPKLKENLSSAGKYDKNHSKVAAQIREALAAKIASEERT